MMLPNFLKLPLLGAFAVIAGCSASAGDDAVDTSSESRLDAVPVLHFGADWSVTTSGVLRGGRKVEVQYDPARMPTCRGDMNGGPAWTVTGYFRVSGGDVKSFTAAGFSPVGHLDNTIELPPSADGADLELWFENTSRWGCQAWDTSYGHNFHFPLQAAPDAPRWIGNVLFANERQTCGGTACESDRKPLANATFTYDTWARQRAAVTELTFQVWKPGTTDWDNPNAWRDLDVQVHYRWRAGAAFQTAYVPIQKRVGNDERYALDARKLDPFLRYGSYPTQKSECPDVDIHPSPGAGYAEAVLELYFTVNGVELRPAPGDVFRGRYQDYAQSWAVCTQ